MPTVRDLKEHLAKYMEDDDVIAWDIWCVSDVEDEVDRRNEYLEEGESPIELTQEEMNGILEFMHNHKDCEYGLTWNHICFGIDDAIRRKGETCYDSDSASQSS